MNWRRGLFRLWIVGSVLFVLAVAFISYSEIKQQFDDAATIAAHQAAQAASQPVEDGLTAYEVGIGPPPAPWATVGMWAAIAFGIPLVVLHIVWEQASLIGREFKKSAVELLGELSTERPQRVE